MSGATPAQTIGPFFAVLLPLGSAELVPPGTPGAIVLEGAVFDGGGAPVPDALIEAWQAAPDGQYVHPNDDSTRADVILLGVSGFGRTMTDAGGGFSFLTVKPGRVAGFDERRQAPHITLSVFARGLLRHLVTRVYFGDEGAANAADPLLQSIADPSVRATLVAAEAGPGRYRFDIHLQGERETAFLAV